MAKCLDCVNLSLPRLSLTQFKCSKRIMVIDHKIEAEFECSDFQPWTGFLTKYNMNIQHKSVNQIVEV